MNPKAFLLLPALIIPAVLLVAGLKAGDEEYPPITPSQIKARQFKPGDRRSIVGKYQELINRELRLFDIDVPLLLKEAILARKVLDLKPERDNIAVLGTFRTEEKAPNSTPPAGPGEAKVEGPAVFFEVERIESAPDDVAIFGAQLEKLLQRPDATLQELLALGESIATHRERFNETDLRPLGRQALGEAFIRAEKELQPDDADGRLHLIRRIHSALKDEEFTLQLLKVQARRFKDHSGTQAFLGELKCFQVQGEWLTYGDFKRKLGFIRSGERWVKPARKELLDLVEKTRKESLTNLILRTRTDREYQLLAQSGKVEKGMTREELADSLGLPDRVERISSGGIEIDQWSYGDRRIYLVNGQVMVALPSGS